MASTALRYEPHKAFITDKVVSGLNAKTAYTAEHNHVEISKLSPSSGSIGWGNEVRFNLPKVGHIEDIWLELTNGAMESGSYIDYWALFAIESLSLEIGSEKVLVKQAHDPIVMWRLAHMTKGQRETWLYNAGGTSPSDDTACICPVFAPWSRMWIDNDIVPLPAHLLNEDIWVVIKFKSAVSMGDDDAEVDAGTTLTGHLHIRRSLTPKKKEGAYMIKSVTFKQGPIISVSASTPTRFNVNHIAGSMSELFVLPQNTAQKALSRYMVKVPSSLFVFYIDSDEIERLTGERENIVLMNANFAYEKDDATQGSQGVNDPIIWSAGRNTHFSATLGQLHVSRGMNLEVEVEFGSNTDCMVMGIMHTLYLIHDGGLVKKQ